MKIILKIISAFLFIVFFGFSLNNTGIVTLKLFFGYQFLGPLVLILLIFFIAGIIFGVLAMFPMLFKYRKEISRHKKNLLMTEQDTVQSNSENL